MRRFLSPLVAVVMAATAMGAVAQEMATLAVLPFVIDRTLTLDINGVQIRAEVLESEFSDLLMQQLVTSRKFKVLERDFIRKVLAENDMTESDYVAATEVDKLRKLLVADYYVLGQIDRIELRRERRRIQITGETAERIEGSFKTHFRVVDNATGQVVYAQTRIQKLDSRDIPVAERRDFTLADYRDRLFLDTAVAAGNDILSGIYPVKIASVNGAQVVLNRGAGMGFGVGSRFEVFSQGAEIRDPDTHAVLGREESRIALIEVTEVLPNLAKAMIVEASGDLAVGAICRPAAPVQVEQAPPDIPRVTPGW
jgi:hypothetical protein